MNKASIVRFLQYALLVVCTATTQHSVNASSSLENRDGNDRKSEFVFKFLPIPKEGTSATPSQSTSRYISKDVTTMDSLTDDEFTTYSDSWTDMTTDFDSDTATAASDLTTPRLYKVKSGPNVDKTNSTEPQTLPSRPRFVFNIIRTTSTKRTKLPTTNSVVESSTINGAEKTSRNHLTTRKSLVTTSEGLRADVGLGLRPKNTGTHRPSHNEEDEEIYGEPTTFHDYELYEHTTDGNVTETPGKRFGNF